MPWKPAIVFERTVTHDRRRRVKTYGFLPKPKVSFGRCGTCGKEIKNPLTHACAVKTDFKRRKKAAQKQGRKQGRRGHNYRTCRDEDCGRPACEAYREGYELGWDDGSRAGQAASRRRT